MAGIQTVIFELLSNDTIQGTHYRTTELGEKVYIKPYITRRVKPQLSFTSESGERKTIRYFKNASSIYQDEQIKNGFPINHKFKINDRKDLLFKKGFLTTSNPKLIEFLKASPEFDGFKGVRDDDTRPLFRIYNPSVNSAKTKKFVFLQSDAVEKLRKMKESDIDRLLIRLFGKAFTIPNNLDDKVLSVIQLINDADETRTNDIDTVISFQTKDDVVDGIDEVVGLAIKHKVISFTSKSTHIQMFVDGGEKAVDLLMIDPTYSIEQKTETFASWLKTREGESVRTIISEEVEKVLNEVEQEELEED